jgi:hypothetical protein
MKFFRRFTLLQITLLSFIIFGLLGFVFFATEQESFTGIGTLAQQFTPTDNLIFNSFLVWIAENLEAGAVIAIVIFGMRRLAEWRKWDSQTWFWLTLFIVFLALFIFGMANHMLRYQDQEINILKSGIFWGVGGLLTFITGFFMVFGAMHFNNNFFIEVQEVFSSETGTAVFAFIIIALIAVYAWAYRGRWLGAKKNVS